MHALFCFKGYNATLLIAYNLLTVCGGGPILTVKRCIALKYMTCTSVYFVLGANLATYQCVGVPASATISWVGWGYS